MLNGIKAVIFDMDGVIIDSEPLWRQAMISSFVEIGIPFTDDDCRLTTGLRFKEVIDFWFKRHHIHHIAIIPDDENKDNSKFTIADYKLDSLLEFMTAKQD